MSELIPMSLRGLALDSKEAPVVLLEDEDGKRLLPIWIGVFEATAIQIALDGIQVERPLTHDLLAAAVKRLGGTPVQVAITELRDNTYHARITVELAEENRVELDSRPSDALALAVRCGADIVVAEEVLEQAHLPSDPHDEEALRRHLESLDPEDLGEYTM